MRRYISDFSITRKTNTEGLPLFDICHKRHKGNQNSVKANEKVTPIKQSTKTKILELLESEDLTLHEIAEKLGKEVHKISGRLSELKDPVSPKIIEVGTRNGAAILRRAA